jgi:molecular chaperone DnaK
MAERSKRKGRIVGIDLGTTNSVVAIMESNVPQVLANEQGSRTTPSVVAYSSAEGELLVGQIAKNQNVLNTENTFSSIKRFIGCNYDEVKEEAKLVSYKVLKDEKGKVKVYSPKMDREFSPEEISSIILKKLVNDASRSLNEDITEAVITVPAYFNDSQRLATKDAGTIAGLDVLRILNEPTAAALAYGLGKNKNEVVLIFDLGGGTFDVSLLEVGNEVFEVLSTSGDTHLGGNDFDQLIVNYIVTKFKEKNGGDLTKDRTTRQRVLEASERTKIELSNAKSTIINIPYLYMTKESEIPIGVELPIDRNIFEELSKPLLERCKKPVLQALSDAKLTKGDVDEVVLVGGSTRIPAVRSLLLDLIGKPLNETVNPDEVVALGAAIQAGIIAGDITELILLDVTPLSLGVETNGGLMTTVLKRNVSIPAKQSELFSTGADNQDTVEIHVLQGERPLAKDNKSLGIFRLNDIPRAPRGIPKINVTFQLDVDGLLSVTAKEEKSGIEQSIKIEGASVLSREEVDSMLKDAEENSEIDRIKKFIISFTYDFDTLLTYTEELLDRVYNIFTATDIELIYFEEVIKAMKEAYLANEFELFDSETGLLAKYEYAHEILLIRYLMEYTQPEKSDGSGPILDAEIVER